MNLHSADEPLTLAAMQGPHEIPKADIRRLLPSAISAMPEGLEKTLTQREFVDLIAFLLEQK